MYFKIRFVGLLTSSVVLLCSMSSYAQSGAKVSFNQNFIEGVHARVDVENPRAVFELVFNDLPKQVKVYPTENYFYFNFQANGKSIWGNLRLDASDRDAGIIHLGYFEYDENGKLQDIQGYAKDFSEKDGITLKKINDFTYSLIYKKRKVIFNLNDIGMKPPRLAKLAKDEVYVGPIFDESGIKFFLVFNQAKKHFMYVLNEDDKPIEEYRTIDNHVLIGKRTGFAYYDDQINNRKILVGIQGNNVQRNNYYDGPFDQLPDNYVDQTNIKQYMEAAYPEVQGKINKFGHFKKHKGSRVMIAAYYIYFDDAELGFVGSCYETFKANANDFYTCITPDHR